MTSSLLRRPADTEGMIHRIRPETAGWTYVGLDVHLIPPGERVTSPTGGREHCLVLVTGRAEIKVDGQSFGELGLRETPFYGSPAAVYVPLRSSWEVTAVTPVELAVCSAPGGGHHAPRIVVPEPMLTRGKGSNARHVTNILSETAEAHGLLVVEVLTPAGHSSSYPPHRHDRDDLPNESQLEETYYHRLNPAQGFAFQRVYTDDGTIDESMAVQDRDVVLVPKGYHPVAAMHGYDLYYLNVMAGPVRTWKFHNDPNHEWMYRG